MDKQIEKAPILRDFEYNGRWITHDKYSQNLADHDYYMKAVEQACQDAFKEVETEAIKHGDKPIVESYEWDADHESCKTKLADWWLNLKSGQHPGENTLNTGK